MSTLFRLPPGASRDDRDPEGSVPSADPTDPVSAGAGGAVPAAGPSRRRRILLWGTLLGLVVLVAGLMTWGSGPAPTTVPLDPGNPSVTGAQALARVLDEHGVRVDVARGQAALESSGVDADTTVLLTRTDGLAQATVERLAALTRDAGRVVLVAPQRFVLRYLEPGVESSDVYRQAGDVATGCDGGDVRRGEQLSHTQAAYRPTSGGVVPAVAPTSACWTDGDGYSAHLSLPATATHGPLVLLGSGTAVGNDEIDEADDAAVVLRTLGHSPRVVWYVPSSSDVPTTDRSRTGELLPAWLGPALALVAASVLGLVLWRGRRLGRLVREPLPVVVRAVETTESRGRLYRKARDSGRAGQVLQEATRRRLAGYLGLAPGTPVAVLVRATAAATGRPDHEVGPLLAGPPPATDDDLLGLAGRLAALEKEIRRP